MMEVIYLLINLEEAQQKVRGWVREVGELQREKFGKKGLHVSFKAMNNELVTEVDTSSEKLLLKAIREAYPDHAILSEESGALESHSDYLWVVDPLDGSVNYSQGIPLFVISVALRYKGETVIGTIYQPVLEEMFESRKGCGAFLNGSRIKVSGKNELQESLVSSGYPYDKSAHQDNNANYFAHFVPKVRQLMMTNTPAYDLACVAAGRLDGYWEINLEPWDIEAGGLLMREAGGDMVYLPEKRGVSVVAGNPAICAQIRNEIRKIDSESPHNLVRG